MKTIQYYFQASLFILLAFGVLAIGSLTTVQAQGEEEELEEGQLPELGVYIPMAEDGFVNIRIVDKKFRLYFMDEERKVKEPVYSSAFIRYENVAKKDVEDRLTLRLSEDGEYQFLTSGRVIKPPFNLWIFLVFTDSADPNKKIPYGRHRLKQ